MSHHVTATATNPSGAVEVVHVQSAATTSAPLDLGSTGSGGLVKTATTQVAGASGTPGANLPVENIEQASNTIQRGKLDLAQTTGAETRLEGLNGVGGGGGGGGGGGAAGAGQANADNPTGAVAQGTENLDTGQNGVGGQTSPDAKNVALNDLPEQDTRSLQA